MNTSINWYFDKADKWQESKAALRKIILSCSLTEVLRWGKPCYELDGNSILLIHTFKEYSALLFMKGVLLKDPESILVQQTANVQGARQLRFKNLQEIIDQEKIIRSYILEAIEVEKSGAQVPFKKTIEFAVPEEFTVALDEIPNLRASFESLTPGRQRGYLLYFGAAKLAKTRVERIEKYIPKIMEGKGLED